MASEAAPPVSAPTAPMFASATLPDSATVLTTTTTAGDAVEPIRTKSLKRARPESTNLTSTTGAGLSPSSKAPRYKGAFIAAPLTGAAAMEDQRRRQEEAGRPEATNAVSDNPRLKALSSLMSGGEFGMSRPQDGPHPTTTLSEGMSIAASAITIPSAAQIAAIESSPASVTSLASLTTTAQTATASPTVVASPTSMTPFPEGESREGHKPIQFLAPNDEPSSRAFTYPGQRVLMEQPDISRAPPRGLSLPMPNQVQQLAPRSPSQKKHKCPYCETEFTRQHNLKSHLLTHSQEKPYVCQNCQMRFRRLHDLKRHMKLHTGERPHICPKCDRKFARGDALARHSKGQGGCAGRRASMGSFGGEDDYEGSNDGNDDVGMEGVTYSNGPQSNEPAMTEEERRRFSLPSIRAQHVAHQGSPPTSHSRTPSTYPPSGPRPGDGRRDSLYPPSVDRRPPSSSGTSPSSTTLTSMSMALSTSGGSMFAQSGMTESPKPLSPAGIHSHELGHDSTAIRTRSPSLATQLQQQNFGRHSGRQSPTGMSLPSPHTNQGPRLPALAGLTGLVPPEQKYTLSSQATSQQTPTSGAHSIASSPSAMFQRFPPGPHHQASSSGDSNNNLFAGGETGVLTYVKTLESKVEQMTTDIIAMQGREKAAQEQIRSQQDHIHHLGQEVAYLRSQIPNQPQPSTGRS